MAEKVKETLFELIEIFSKCQLHNRRMCIYSTQNHSYWKDTVGQTVSLILARWPPEPRANQEMGGNLDNSGGSGRRRWQEAKGGGKKKECWMKEERMLEERREKRKREKMISWNYQFRPSPKLSPSLGLDSERVHIYQIMS